MRTYWHFSPACLVVLVALLGCMVLADDSGILPSSGGGSQIAIPPGDVPPPVYIEAPYQEASDPSLPDFKTRPADSSASPPAGPIEFEGGAVWTPPPPAPYFGPTGPSKPLPVIGETRTEMFGPLRNGVTISSETPKEVRLLARPETFALGTVYQQAPDEIVSGDDMVVLGVGSFSVDPSLPYGYGAWMDSLRSWWTGARSSREDMLAAPRASGEGYYILKLDRRAAQPDPEPVQKSLEGMGLRFVGATNFLTYIVHMARSREAQVRGARGVTWLEPYLPAYKVSPGLGRTPLPPDLAGEDEFELKVVGFKDDPLEVLIATVHSLGGIVLGTEWGDSTKLVYARLHRFAIPALAQVEGIAQIEEVPPRVLHNEIFPSSTQTNEWMAAGDRPLWRVGVDGRTQVAGVMDGEFELNVRGYADDCTHPIAWPRALDNTRRKVIYAQEETGYPNAPTFDCAGDDHGTQTSQNIAADTSAYDASTNPGGIGGSATGCPMTDGSDGDGWPDFDGAARGAKLALYKTSGVAGESPGMSGLLSAGARVINKSYGFAFVGSNYDDTSAAQDRILYNNKEILVTNSAGDGGDTAGIEPPATSKNDVTVGANFQYPLFATLTLFSSKGPEVPGRPGPTLVNPGEQDDLTAGATYLSSLACRSASSFGVNCNPCQKAVGTSFSAPFTAADATLIRDYFQQGFYPSGTATGADQKDVTGPLVKAMLIAATNPVTDTKGRVGQTQRVSGTAGNLWGYGYPVLANVLPLLSNPKMVPGLQVWDLSKTPSGIGGNGHPGPDSYTVKMAAGGSFPMRVALVWYDPPGAVGSGNLLNDLNLTVTSPGGALVYHGNQFTSNWSAPGATGWDSANPTEAVFIPAADVVAGEYTITVTAPTVTVNDPTYLGQTYSLVVAGNVVRTSLVQFDRSQYQCAGSSTVTVRDPDGSHGASYVSANTVVASSGGDSETNLSFSGSGGVYSARLPIAQGAASVNDGTLEVQSGQTLTVTYNDGSANRTAAAAVRCEPSLSDGGHFIEGGCDPRVNFDIFYGPSENNWTNEFWTSYMDAGEFNTYTFLFRNLTGAPLTDVRVALSFSGAGAAKMTAYNSPVLVGAVPAGGLCGAAFGVYTDPTTAGLTAVNMDFDVTSPADGFTSPTRITQPQLLQANDKIARQSACHTFSSGLDSGFEVVPTTNGFLGTPAVANPWIWSGAATSPLTVGGDTRGAGGNSGLCYDPKYVSSAMVGNSGTGSSPPGQNFATNAESLLMWDFQPALRGNGPNGQPYSYIWLYHAFYGASEAPGNASGAWNAYYDDKWDSATHPTGDEALLFPHFAGPKRNAWFSQSAVFDYVSSWNWDSANIGYPDTAPWGPPNWHFFPLFNKGAFGPATASRYFCYGHAHADANSTSSHRDIALDNDELVYDEYYAVAQTTPPCSGGQAGLVAFDRFVYSDCPSSTAVISVLKAGATGPLNADVSDPTTGDSEQVTLTGSAPYFHGTLTIATNAGQAANDGTLLVLPGDKFYAAFYDQSPSGYTTAEANAGCPGGDVKYLSYTQVSDDGDNDGYADNNELVTMDIAIQNNMSTALTNAVVTLVTTTPGTVDCVTSGQALYGTVAPGVTATNPAGDRFTFHVAPSVKCTDWQNPPKANFLVFITGDGYSGSSTFQSFQIHLDLDPTPAAQYSYTQNFNADPGWVTGATPDDEGGCAARTYINSFQYRLNGHADLDGAYGAWNYEGGTFTSDGAPGLPPQDSSTLYSPVFLSYGTSVTLQFDVAYKFDDTMTAAFQGAKVQYSLNGGAWKNLDFSTPSQVSLANSADEYCMPLNDTATSSTTTDKVWWSKSGQNWKTTNAASVTTVAGQTIQFRWRDGTISLDGYNATSGFGVDNVIIKNLRQTYTCETTRNTGLPGCPSGPTRMQTAAADASACADTGVAITWPPPTSWGDNGANTSNRGFYVVRTGTVISSLLTATSTSYSDTTGVNGTIYSYAVRAVNGAGMTTDYTAASAADNVATAPTTIAIAAADVSACADSGVAITWPKDATDWGDSGTGTRTYSVLRDGAAIASGGCSGNLPYGTTTCTDQTGDNGTSYTYTVQYTNGCGLSTTTAGVSAVDQVSTPPTGLSVGPFYDLDPCAFTGISLTWKADATDWGDFGLNPSARFYIVYRSNPITDGGCTVHTISDHLPYGTTTWVDTTGEPSTEYCYAIKYFNSCGNAQFSSGYYRTDVAGSAPTGLGAITAADVSPCADTGVKITWPKDATSWGDNNTGTRTYEALRNGAVLASGIAYGTLTYTDTTGVNGTSYTYSVRYHNGCAMSADTAGVSAADVVDTTPCPPVGNTLKVAKSGSNAALSWTAVTCGDLAGYRVYGATSYGAAFPAGWTLLGTPTGAAATDPLASAYIAYEIVSLDQDGCASPE